MHAHEAAPLGQMGPQGAARRVGEDVAAGGEEHHGGAAGQGRCQLARVLGGQDLEAVVRAQVAERLDPGGDGVVPEAGGAGEDDDPGSAHDSPS